MWQGQTPEPRFLWTVWENQQLGGGGSPGKGLLYSPPAPACFSPSSGAVLTGAPAQPCPPAHASLGLCIPATFSFHRSCQQLT